MCLVKPQFEAGREKVGKKGVVRDPAVHLEVLEHFLDHARGGGIFCKGYHLFTHYRPRRAILNTWAGWGPRGRARSGPET